MSDERIIALVILSVLTMMALALTGDHFFDHGQGLPSLAGCYALDALALLGWLIYFGSRS